jgi:hypothetical protein
VKAGATRLGSYACGRARDTLIAFWRFRGEPLIEVGLSIDPLVWAFGPAISFRKGGAGITVDIGPLYLYFVYRGKGV